MLTFTIINNSGLFLTFKGEVNYQMQYKDTVGKPFDWLYVDADTLRQHAGKCGFSMETVAKGEHYDYLARISRKTARTNAPDGGARSD